jgi:hypothetical protein
MLSVEKPGTPEELVHVGVKGMRWGVRKAVDTAIGTKTAGRRPSSYKKASSGNAKTRKAASKEAHQNNAPRLTKTKAWKSWSKLAQKNVDHYNTSKAHRVGSEAATGLLVVIGAVTVRNFVKYR